MSNLSDLMQNLSACWCETLQNSEGGAPATCCWIAGEPVVADCCSGYGWVRILGAYPTLDFPAELNEAQRCPANEWAVLVEIGIARCAASPCDPLQNACCDSELAVALILADDYLRAVNMLHCCLPVAPDDVVVGQWTQGNPLGGCIAGTLRATIRFEGEPTPA